VSRLLFSVITDGLRLMSCCHCDCAAVEVIYTLNTVSNHTNRALAHCRTGVISAPPFSWSWGKEFFSFEPPNGHQGVAQLPQDIQNPHHARAASSTPLHTAMSACASSAAKTLVCYNVHKFAGSLIKVGPSLSGWCCARLQPDTQLGHSTLLCCAVWLSFHPETDSP
jgi:hypothetical protein